MNATVLSFFTIMKNKNIQEQGFSLLELLMVLFMIALVAGLVPVFFSQALSNVNSSTTAREIAAMLKLARTDAVAKKQYLYVAVNPEKGTFYIGMKKNKKKKQTQKEIFFTRGLSEKGENEASSMDVSQVEVVEDVQESAGEGAKRKARYLNVIKKAGEGVLFSVPEGEKTAEGEYRIFFSPHGGSSGGEIIVKQKEDKEKGVQYRVQIEAVTGKVRVSEREKDEAEGEK